MIKEDEWIIEISSQLSLELQLSILFSIVQNFYEFFVSQQTLAVLAHELISSRDNINQ